MFITNTTDINYKVIDTNLNPNLDHCLNHQKNHNHKYHYHFHSNHDPIKQEFHLRYAMSQHVEHYTKTDFNC